MTLCIQSPERARGGGEGQRGNKSTTRMRAPRHTAFSDLRDAPLAERACVFCFVYKMEISISNVVFPRKLLKEFINMYRDSPCLWDRECSAYKHKKKRHDAISKLTTLVQQYDASATRVHVLRKIESLRSCVRREHKRVLESRQTNDDEIYTPNLWYYDMFSFIFNNDATNHKIKQDLTDQSAVNILIVESEEEHGEILGDESGAFETHSYDEYGMSGDTNESGPSKDFVNFSGKRQWTEVEDEYDAIGINVAAKLRNLGSNMRIIAEKLINDVLFQAQLNSLNSSTVLSTTDPFKQDK